MSEFEDYAARIEAATIQLESEVAGITQWGSDLGDAVGAAEGYATDAQNAANEATQALQAFTSSNPLVKSRYGLVEAYTADLSVVSVEDASDLYGTVVYAEAGMTQVVLDAVPDAGIAGFHFYVVNRSGNPVGINSNTNTVNGGTVADQGFAIVLFNTSEFEVLSYGAGTGGGGTGGDFDWTTIPTATESLKGLMSATDKAKLNSLQEYTVATTSANGLMSAADKTKLNGIEAGAEANVQADFNAASGAALILNKPDVVYKGPLVYDPVYEENTYNTALGTNGYMTPEYAVHLEELWTEYDAGAFTGGGGGGTGDVEEAPEDGEQYVRSDGEWVAIELASVVTEINPITEIPETVITDGYMQGEDKERLDELWTGYDAGDFTGGGGSGGITDAPSDGSLYARSNGSWEILEDASSSYDPVMETTVYERGLLSAADKEALDELWTGYDNGDFTSGGGSSVSYTDLITRGQEVVAPSKYKTIAINNQTDWDDFVTPAGLMDAVFGVRTIKDVPFHLGAVPIFISNGYSGRVSEAEKSPWAANNYNWCLIEFRPTVVGVNGSYETVETASLEGSNVFCEVTFITASTSDVPANPSTPVSGTKAYRIRKYFNYSKMLTGGDYTGDVDEQVNWAFKWQMLSTVDATERPSD